MPANLPKPLASVNASGCRHGIAAAPSLLPIASMKRSTSCLFCSDIGDAPAVDDDDQSARSQRASRASGPMRGATTAVLSIVFRSEEHTSELQSLMRKSYAVF